MAALLIFEALPFSVSSYLLFSRLIPLLADLSLPSALYWFYLLWALSRRRSKSCAEGCMELDFVSPFLSIYLKQYPGRGSRYFGCYFFTHHVITKWLSSRWLWQISRSKALAIAVLLCIQTAYIPPYIFI